MSYRDTGQKGENNRFGGRKELRLMRLFVDKKEVPVLMEALEMYIATYPQDHTAQKLLDKVADCLDLQVSQKPKNEQ